jgi:peroxiredoxin
MLNKLVLVASLATASFAITLPRPAGEVEFDVPGKGKQLLSQYKGKVVLLVAVITTCEQCQRTTKVLSEIQKQLGPRGLQVIEVVFSDTDTADQVNSYAKNYQPAFPIGIIDGEFFIKWSQVTPQMRPTVPMTFIIDRQGLIQAQYMGAHPMMDERYVGENLRAKLMQYLGPGKAPAAKAPAKKSK